MNKLDAKYKPRYRDRDGGEDERRAIILEKSNIKEEMDTWHKKHNEKYVYAFPKESISFKEKLENAIANM